MNSLPPTKCRRDVGSIRYLNPLLCQALKLLLQVWWESRAAHIICAYLTLFTSCMLSQRSATAQAQGDFAWQFQPNFCHSHTQTHSSTCGCRQAMGISLQPSVSYSLHGAIISCTSCTLSFTCSPTSAAASCGSFTSPAAALHKTSSTIDNRFRCRASISCSRIPLFIRPYRAWPSHHLHTHVQMSTAPSITAEKSLKTQKRPCLWLHACLCNALPDYHAEILQACLCSNAEVAYR